MTPNITHFNLLPAGAGHFKITVVIDWCESYTAITSHMPLVDQYIYGEEAEKQEAKDELIYICLDANNLLTISK